MHYHSRIVADMANVKPQHPRICYKASNTGWDTSSFQTWHHGTMKRLKPSSAYFAPSPSPTLCAAASTRGPALPTAHLIVTTTHAPSTSHTEQRPLDIVQDLSRCILNSDIEKKPIPSPSSAPSPSPPSLSEAATAPARGPAPGEAGRREAAGSRPPRRRYCGGGLS